MSNSLTVSSPKSKGTIWGRTAEEGEDASRVKKTELKNQGTNQSTNRRRPKRTVNAQLCRVVDDPGRIPGHTRVVRPMAGMHGLYAQHADALRRLCD